MMHRLKGKREFTSRKCGGRGDREREKKNSSRIAGDPSYLFPHSPASSVLPLSISIMPLAFDGFGIRCHRLVRKREVSRWLFCFRMFDSCVSTGSCSVNRIQEGFQSSGSIVQNRAEFTLLLVLKFLR